MTFLQWAWPQLRLHGAGFRKVHHQVGKRIRKRLLALHLSSLEEYRLYLKTHSEEWRVLDSLCRITISRFFRDQEVYGLLTRRILPQIAAHAGRHAENTLRIWSAGCASGEEPYSLAILWKIDWQKKFQDFGLRILATDADPLLLRRARAACYPFSSLKNLPETWRRVAFTASEEKYCLRPVFKKPVLFAEHDIRCPFPVASLQLILCRNLVYTYFEPSLQREITEQLHAALQPGGILVTGIHEALPQSFLGFTPLFPQQGIYLKS